MTDDTDLILSARAVSRTYRMGRVRVPVLRGVDLDVQRGAFIAILGASGSGKSTLLHILGGLDRIDPDPDPEHGVFYEGRRLSDRSQRELDHYRSRDVGFVFQFYHLLPELNVVENVLIGAMIRHGRMGYFSRRAELRDRAASILGTLGLDHRLRHNATVLSGGERQRVAIARALINEPSLLLADEPTGNLDRETGRSILDAMSEIRTRLNQTIVMVTHDPDIARDADRIVRLEDGRLAADNNVAIGSERA